MMTLSKTQNQLKTSLHIQGFWVMFSVSLVLQILWLNGSYIMFQFFCPQGRWSAKQCLPNSSGY